MTNDSSNASAGRAIVWGYHLIFQTPYGNKIKGVRCLELKKVLENYSSIHWRNQAFISWLKQLPDELEIWLYWC